MSEIIDAITQELQAYKEKYPDIMGIILTNDEGMPVSSALQEDIDETKYTAAVAEFLTSSSKIQEYLDESETNIMMLKLGSSYFIVHPLESGLTLGTRFSKDTKLGIAYTVSQMLAKKLNEIIKSE